MIPLFVMLAVVLAARAAGALAMALAILLVAMFPANVHAARTGATLGGRPATPLALRLPLQLLWIGLLLWIALGATAARVAG